MKILVVGGPSTHGEVSEQERFDVRLAQYLADQTQTPSVLHLAVPGGLGEAAFALEQPFVRLSEFDLIVLQTGDLTPTCAADRTAWQRWQEAFGALPAQLGHLRRALTRLEPHRDRVVVLTPPPGNTRLQTGLRRWVSHRIVALCRLWAFRVVNRCQADLRYEFLFEPHRAVPNRLGHHYLSLEIIRELRWHPTSGDTEPAWL